MYYFLVCIFCTLLAQFPMCAEELISLILPMQHQALDDIATGFQEELSFLRGKEGYKVKIVNAQGDLALQMSLLKSLQQNGCKIYLPVGTQCTQMTLNVIKDAPIVALAANLPQDVQKNYALTGVLDELSVNAQMQFLQTLLPNLKAFTVVHSGSEKVHKELEDIQTYAKAHGIGTQILMAQNLQELQVCAKSIQKNADCIFVLKDHLIVSGITILINQASELKIPLISSDEGSVKTGAALSLGVTEKEIGKEGAKLVNAILNGQNAQSLPINSVKDVHIFVNVEACKKQNISRDAIVDAAKKLDYVITAYGDDL